MLERNTKGQFILKQIPWNKGTRGIMKPNKTSFKIGNTPPKHNDNCLCFRCNKDYIVSEKEKSRRTLFAKNKLWLPNKGKTLSQPHKDKISKALKGKLPKNYSLLRSPEIVKKSLRRRGKSSLEIKFEKIISDLKLPYKFVGNGDVFIANKIPDFVESSGKKIAIEVFYRTHKERFRGGLRSWKQKREKLFNDNGWKIIYFDETQVNEETVKTVMRC